MTDGARDRWICHGCVEDPFLKKEVRTGGKRAKCSYCGTMRKSLSLEWLANRTHDVLVQHFNLTTERSGDAVGYVIQEIAEVDEPVAEDVRKYLSDLHDGEGGNHYGDDAYYEARGADGRYLRETWERFCREIQFRSRFFSPRQALDEIFRDIGALRTWRGVPVTREIGPGDENRYIFRARKALSKRELWKILSAPDMELGPPPPRAATAGRMNAAGVSVFYGGEDKETCLAEARAPVGSYVVLGRFEIVRPVRLLESEYFGAGVCGELLRS